MCGADWASCTPIGQQCHDTPLSDGSHWEKRPMYIYLILKTRINITDKREKRYCCCMCAGVAELPADLPARVAYILDHFSSPDMAKLMCEAPERLASKAAKQLQKALDCERDSEGVAQPEAIHRALQACLSYLHQAALLERPKALGPNIRCCFTF